MARLPIVFWLTIFLELSLGCTAMDKAIYQLIEKFTGNEDNIELLEKHQIFIDSFTSYYQDNKLKHEHCFNQNVKLEENITKLTTEIDEKQIEIDKKKSIIVELRSIIKHKKEKIKELDGTIEEKKKKHLELNAKLQLNQSTIKSQLTNIETKQLEVEQEKKKNMEFEIILQKKKEKNTELEQMLQLKESIIKSQLTNMEIYIQQTLCYQCVIGVFILITFVLIVWNIITCRRKGGRMKKEVKQTEQNENNADKETAPDVRSRSRTILENSDDVEGEQNELTHYVSLELQHHNKRSHASCDISTYDLDTSDISSTQTTYAFPTYCLPTDEQMRKRIISCSPHPVISIDPKSYAKNKRNSNRNKFFEFSTI